MNSVNFRTSDCASVHVNYIESADGVVCSKHAFSNFGASFFKSFACVDPHLAMATG